MLVCGPERVQVHHVYAAAHGDQKRAPDSLALDLQVTVYCQGSTEN